jgi:hypothetical protein
MFIENPEAGRCYAFVYLPDIYATPDGVRYEVFTKKKKILQNLEQKYETRQVWHNYPPRLVQKPNISLPEGTKLIDPIYKSKEYRQEVVPATTKWISRRGVEINVNYDLDFAHIFSVVEVPAQYQTIVTQYDEVKPARKVIGKDTVALDSAMLFQYYWEVHEKKLITYKKPFANKNSPIISFTDTFYCKTILPKDAVLIKKGKPSKWQEVFRAPHGYGIIIDIQQALRDKGYYKGEIDDFFGKKTKAALIKFQKDNNLSVEILDRKTMEILDLPTFKKEPFYRLIYWNE